MTNNKIKINLDSLKSRREWKRHKVKDGHNVFRILPPFGEASNGYPYRKWQIIWGLADPENGRQRPFASSMTSEQACPVTEYVQALKKRSETLKSQLQANGESEEAIKARLADLNKVINDLSPKTVYLYNAADKAGEVGLLELKSTAHKKMKTEMSQYINDYNQDPTSLNSEDDDSGLWFDIIRTGEGRDTEYDVKKMQNKIKKATGGFSFEDDRSPLSDNIVANYNSLGYDLSTVYQLKTYEELKEVLEANMEALTEFCPDANLAVEVTLTKATATASTSTGNGSSGGGSAVRTQPAPAAKPASKVALKLADGDDLVDDVVSLNGHSRADTDFLAEAEALLRS